MRTRNFQFKLQQNISNHQLLFRVPFDQSFSYINWDMEKCHLLIWRTSISHIYSPLRLLQQNGVSAQ